MPSNETKGPGLKELLEKLAINDPSKFRDGDGPAEQRKDMKDYKFWRTQPVTSFDESVEDEGTIDGTKTAEEIPKEPLAMLPAFEWCDVDILDPQQLEDVYLLLNENYVEDKDATFRFNYTREFFNWALKSPGWRGDWLVGVRVKETGKLIAFISAIPVTLEVRGKTVPSVEINFLCVHKQLRSKRLTPVLIKEITRRVNRCDIWHALYTAGTVLPSPVSVCRYTHRPIDWNKLYEVGFTDLPMGKSVSEMTARYAIPNKTKTLGLRPMVAGDVDATLSLLQKYQARFDLRQIFSREEFSHWFLGGPNAEQDKVIFSYVVEDADGRITDFFSFYSLPFSILNHSVHKELGIGYLFYYATDADFEFTDRFSTEATAVLRKRLNSIMGDAVVLARRAKMDVFNALTSQDNALFLEDLKFGPGDGFLNFYLFNYKTFPITGGIREDKSYDTERRSNVGVVML
ncbi:glycylpeptide N-tetradecanoyltransferase NMT1 KNAG_0B02570 [Huiozyma naganishii CBS 8797]|uniref:Glycylpeptide N-tetradecanoyltransferase n=1 Tax=Huiozyma naganishii (strain ATCC MYA-139 / BCRC 22969 / CBS 8797 / KCTC 17520 / NBRC 10181 / NCYC 3082 / Yp74L-3) TaxID=1071383 RepID=J7S3F8_HUIN7|nr:hypothetical protein KNAG_0B02570 [Kazachstania naganishii CBS 8797]CCK68699.1 hypothetical protein KNAG_0B02570 [Kazachstania naganishii CBS 8797]